jgi:UDP:flavonoid glycosyltransferase YjiC (YdhE family)
VIISSFTSDVYAVAIAEKLGVRLISTPLQPAMFATRYGPAIPGAPLPRRKSLVNLVFSKLFLEPFRWRITGKLVNQFRRQVLNLPEQTATENLEVLRRTPTVQAYSRHVVPPPDDWPANFHTAGYWFLDEHSSWQPPPALADFLQAGDPPVYVGFGSMTGRNPQALTQILVEAITQSGQRAILQSGWAGMGRTPLPDSVFRLDTAPHSWLFPRMKVIVHHGGAGTTGESLRAGVPTLVIPTMSDQPYWGQRVAALGAGPPPIPRHQLTTSKLAAAIQQAATDRKMQANAVALGQCIRAEDGLSLGMRLIEQYLG